MLEKLVIDDEKVKDKLDSLMNTILNTTVYNDIQRNKYCKMIEGRI